MTSFAYGVLGAGRQGVAAAYDLAVRGDAGSVVLADVDGAAAQRAAEVVNHLVGGDPARGVALDVGDPAALVAWLRPLRAFLSAVPYRLNLAVTDAAIEAGTSMCDLGGNADVVFAQLARDSQARAAGICVIPDCGQVPGTGANLMAYAVRALDAPEEVILLDGGLPVDPAPPWRYALTFNMDGLTNEYDGTAAYVVDGRPVDVACFEESEYELVDFGEPYGTLEAFVTAGGTTTAVSTLGPGLRTLKNKTLRYPGHAAQWKAFRDAGFFGQERIAVDGAEVVPREVFHALIEPRIRATPDTRDVVLNRVIGRGQRGGAPVELTLDVVTRYSDELGLTAMQQATGWHAAIVCARMASGAIEPGARPVEVAVDPFELVEQFRLRGFEVSERVVPWDR